MTIEAPVAGTRETLSQLVARILDQLSLSAWLPAGALVSIAVFLVKVRVEGNVADAMTGIIRMGWTSLALLIGAVVLVTMITQAFAFGAIRLLEGYWGPSQMANKLADIGCWNRRRIRRRLEERLDRYQIEAGAMARERMLRSRIPKEIVDLVEAMRVGNSTEGADPEMLRRARGVTWRSSAPPSKLRRLDAVSRRLSEYPLEYRVLPTRVGNLIRSYEDRAHDPERGRLEDMVLRDFHRLPIHMQSQHDEHRSRLDLYCSMLVIAAISLVSAAVAFAELSWTYIISATLAALVLGFLVYRAIIASARAYGSILVTIGAWLRSETDAD